MNADTIQEYIEISRFLGGYTELVQGSGGNISVKEGNTLCIKSSGKRLCATTEKEGYTLCSIAALGSAQEPHEAILEGGCVGERPSMEVWFHLLPSKWVIHLHPTFLLGALCSKGWRRLHTRYTHGYIAYTTPGKELADAIFQMYKGQKVLFLQNHGVIVAAESAVECLEILDQLWREAAGSTVKPPLFLQAAWNLQARIQDISGGRNLFLKACSHIRSWNERFFLPITPDCSLFLKQFPLVQETSDDCLDEKLVEYWGHFKTSPSVVLIRGRTFVIGQSYQHCCCIEEILESYIEIVNSTPVNDLTFFSEDALLILQNSPEEKHRLTTI